MNVTLVQFSHGILALSDDVSVHVTHTQDEVDPHPDNLYNPATGFAPNEDAQMRANIGAEAAAAAEEERLRVEAVAAEAAKATAKTKK